MAQILFNLFVILLLFLVIWLFLRKADLQLRYLQLKRGKQGRKGDFLRFSWGDTAARKERWQAILMFPMLFPVELDDEREDLNDLKRSVKRIHIQVYLVLILLIIMAIYSERIF